MRHHRRAVIPAAVWIGLLACGGCTDNAPSGAQEKATAAPSAPEGVDWDEVMANRKPVPYYVDREWRVATGERDENNRYSSAVEVRGIPPGAQPKPEEAVKLCSGVVVSPRLVLTAASCLCRRREAAPGSVKKSVIDSTSCATSATIRTIVHERRSPQSKMVTLFNDYDGAVTAHPAFKVVLDELGSVISSEADLATIALEEPVDIPAIELADLEVKVGDSLVVVGYGDSEKSSDDRRFSTHSVTKTLESGGRIAFEQPRAYGYKGARGGPCLRVTGKGASVAAVLGVPEGREASFTSVYPYAAWLREEIRRAAAMGDAHPGQP